MSTTGSRQAVTGVRIIRSPGSRTPDRDNTIIYVAQTDQPYAGDLVLPKGAMLIGSAFGLDALRAEGHGDLPAMPEMKGEGPVISGGIVAYGDNLIAGCTIVADRNTGLVASGSSGLLDLRNVYFRTSRRGVGLLIQGHEGTLSLRGGGLTATAQGGGMAVNGGNGDITFDRFPVAGDFTTAIAISNRRRGNVVFKARSDIDVTDASGDAVNLTNMPRPVTVRFESVLRIHGHGRGFVASGVEGLFVGTGESAISTVNGATLTSAKVAVSCRLHPCRQNGLPGSMQEGIAVNHFAGSVTIGPADLGKGKPGSGGLIQWGGQLRSAPGAERPCPPPQSDHFRQRDQSSRQGREVRRTLRSEYDRPLHAAIYLRHVGDSSFDDILVDGGGAIQVVEQRPRPLIQRARGAEHR